MFDDAKKDPLGHLESKCPHRILIFGATGLLGFHLLKALAYEKDWKVVLCIRNFAERNFEIPEHWEIVDFSQWKKFEFSMFDHVVNLIGLGKASADRDQIEQNNFNIVKELIDHAVMTKATHFLHISSIAARSGRSGRIEDASTLIPRPTVYATAKAEIEKYLISAGSSLNITTLAPTYMLGGHDIYLNSSGILLNIFYRRLRHYVNHVKNFVSPKDVAEAIVLCIKTAQMGSFLVSAHNVQLDSFLRLCCRHLNVPFTLEERPAADYSSLSPFEQEFMWPSDVVPSKKLEEMGFIPQVSLDEMVGEAVADLRRRRLIF